MTIRPRAVTAQVGDTVTLQAQVSGLVGTWTHRWSRSVDGVQPFVAIPNATEARLVLAGVNLADSGAVFRVTVTGSDGFARHAVATLTVAAAPGIVFTDGDFGSGLWAADARENPTGVKPAHTATVEPGGGAPGAWLNLLFQIPPGTGSASVSYLHRDMIYDPRAQGAVLVLDYAEDCRTLQTSDIRYVESHPIFEQAGRRYAAIYSNVCQIVLWSDPASRASLRAADFSLVEGPPCAAGESCPDFSASGLPMRLGFRRIVWGAPGDSIGHGIDNWTVTVWRR